jgi:signal transduction histidine kinase
MTSKTRVLFVHQEIAPYLPETPMSLVGRYLPQATQESGIEMAGHLNFNLQIDPELENFSFRTNVKQATRALSLLLDNAQKFTKEGSVRLVVSRIQDKATIQFSVEDTGIGIPENEAEHIFDEFVQLDDYYVGTGIGLTIARSIVRRMGGDIKLDTDYKEGARFLMTIPTTKK